MVQYQCPQCGMIGEIGTGKPNFVCRKCDYTKDVVLRRELVNLNHPVEGPIMMELVAKSLRD